MPKCWRCGKSGVFLQLSSSGLCMTCFEEAADFAVSTLAKLKESKEERLRFCQAMDRLEISDAIERAKPIIMSSPFSTWDISIHFKKEQQERIKRSRSVNILRYDTYTRTAEITGSNGNVYTTSFLDCSCRDFSTRNLPCKHMYKLLTQYGNVELSHLLLA